MSANSNAWFHIDTFNYYLGDPERPEHINRLMDLAALRHELEDAIAIAAQDAANYEGITWAQIGDALGVTRQSAHARYAKRRPTV